LKKSAGTCILAIPQHSSICSSYSSHANVHRDSFSHYSDSSGHVCIKLLFSGHWSWLALQGSAEALQSLVMIMMTMSLTDWLTGSTRLAGGTEKVQSTCLITLVQQTVHEARIAAKTQATTTPTVLYISCVKFLPNPNQDSGRHAASAA